MTKEAALRALGSSFFTGLKLRAIRSSGVLTILNLHRVAPNDASSYPPLEPALFEYLLCFLKKHFQIVTFGTLRETESGLPKLILSFDDAYEDFDEHAAPLLERHAIRVNQNVIPQCIETGMPPLNVIVQDFVGKAPFEFLEKLEVPGFRCDVPRASRCAFGNRLSAFLKNKPMVEQADLAENLLTQVARCPGFQPTRMMSLDQLRRTAAVHEIGAHSFSHASLAYETDDYLRDDIARCRRWMDEKLELPLDIYAVPNGSYRPSQVEILRGARIPHILLVDENFSSTDTDLHRRFTFDANSLQEVRFRATGGFRWPAKVGAVQ